MYMCVCAHEHRVSTQASPTWIKYNLSGLVLRDIYFSLVYPEADPEIRIRVQLVYLEVREP